MSAAVTVTADIAVIGGGIAGMSVAAELGASATVVVLEQERELAYHASGRSAAAFLESYGSPEIRTLTRASRPLFEAAGERLLSPRPMLWIASEAGAAELAGLLAEEPSLRRIEVGEALDYCPSLRAEWLAGVAVEDAAQDLDVAALFDHYRRLGLARGVRLLTATGVTGAHRAGGGWRLETAQGRVEVGRVVNAAGAWADEVAARHGVARLGLAPLRRTVAIVSCPAVARTWPLVCDVLDGFYFRPEGDALLLSPVDETPSEPIDVRPDTVDIALAIERANEATTLELRHVRRAWAGLRTFAADRNPVVGPDPAEPTFFWLAGQGGYGMQTAPAMAWLAAAVILGDGPPPGLTEVAARLDPGRFRAA